MRTPGLGDMRLSSTSGVCPIAWTMSPYFPPHGLLSRRGSITSKSIALYPGTLRSPSYPETHLRKTLTALVAVLAIALAGCATSKDNANTQTYPQEAKDNFVDTCTATANKVR